MKEAGVGGNLRPGLDQQDVAWDERLGVDLPFAAVAQGRGARLGSRCSASSERAARYSWTKPTTALKISTTPITPASRYSPIASVTAAAAASM